MMDDKTKTDETEAEIRDLEEQDFDSPEQLDHFDELIAKLKKEQGQ